MPDGLEQVFDEWKKRQAQAQTRQDDFIDIRDEAGKLLLRYNPEKNLIEIQRRNTKTVIDLDQYRKKIEQEKAMDMIVGQGLFFGIMSELHKESATSAATQGGADGGLSID